MDEISGNRCHILKRFSYLATKSEYSLQK